MGLDLRVLPRRPFGFSVHVLTDGGTYDTSKGTKWVDIGPAWRGILREGANPVSDIACCFVTGGLLLTPCVCSRWSNSMDKVVFEAAHSKGGHFAAHFAAVYARRRLLKDV